MVWRNIAQSGKTAYPMRHKDPEFLYNPERPLFHVGNPWEKTGIKNWRIGNKGIVCNQRV
ncbi:hypothetical protein JCM25156A_29240 [Komagataeibacter kakiaceti JCM 25156]